VLQEIEKLKNKIQNAELEKAKCEGRLESLHQKLQSYGITDVKEVEAIINNLDAERLKIEENINKKINKLKDLIEEV